MGDLIDTTEMYLRTILELDEEAVPARRARLVERLRQSGPTVSQTVQRLERLGLVVLADDLRLVLTDAGRCRAVRVMRKHRLAERLLTDVVGLGWELAHQEACRWEHVMSEAVERRIVELLGAPLRSPYGNAIPGLSDLGIDAEPEAWADRSVPLASLAAAGGEMVVRSLSEQLQKDVELLSALRAAGIAPGTTITARATDTAIDIRAKGSWITLPDHAGNQLYVEAV